MSVDSAAAQPATPDSLIERCLSGDQAAWETVVRQNWRKVFNVAYKFVGKHDEAEDLTQDIFLKIWLQRDKLTEVESFKSYIYVVGRNQVINALRKKIVETAATDMLALREDLQAPDLQLEGKDAYRMLMEGVERLTPQQKLIFKMSRIEGLTHEDIAQRLGLSKNTVKVHMVIALNFLRGWLRDLGYLSLLLFFYA